MQTSSVDILFQYTVNSVVISLTGPGIKVRPT